MSDSGPTLEDVQQKIDRFERLLAGEVKPAPVRRPRRSVALDRFDDARRDSERRQQSRLANPGRDDTDDDDDIGLDPDLVRDDAEVLELARRMPEPSEQYRRSSNPRTHMQRAAHEWCERERLRDAGLDPDALERQARLIELRGVFEDIGLCGIAEGDDTIVFICERYEDYLAAAIREVERNR